jgi:hypothetical protein
MSLGEVFSQLFQMFFFNQFCCEAGHDPNC